MSGGNTRGHELIANFIAPNHLTLDSPLPNARANQNCNDVQNYAEAFAFLAKHPPR